MHNAHEANRFLGSVSYVCIFPVSPIANADKTLHYLISVHQHLQVAF